MADAPYSTDSQAWEVKPGLRVADLQTVEACEEAVLYLDMQTDKMMGQIGRAEAGEEQHPPGWRTRVQAALRWTARVRKAVNIKSTALRTADKQSDVLKAAIGKHKEAVLADEANFTDAFEPICEEAAAASMEVEVAAFQEFVATPCHSWQDVKAKVNYLLHGTVGQRTPLLDCLSYEEYAPAGTDLSEVFLRSLVVQGGAHADPA